MSHLKMHIGKPAAWIEVTGEDSFSFLQGQCTNDLRSPAPTPVTYNLWLDRKGRVLADSFILQESEDRLYLYSYHSPAAVLIERLEPYIIADDVVLRDLTPSATSATLWGSAVHDVLLHAGFERPVHGSFFHADRRFLFSGRRSESLNVDLIVLGDDNEETMAKLTAAVEDAQGSLVGEDEVELERIKARIPAVPRDAGPSDLPQETGLEPAAISYNKGCYLGQEVMSRIRSMGKVRRTLAQVSLGDEEVVLPTPLFDGPREVGSMRSVAGSTPRLGLALVRTDCLESAKAFSLAPEAPRTVEITWVDKA